MTKLRTVGDDAQLVAQLRAGDEATFTRVVGELTPGLARLVRGVLRDAALVDEVIQDTWLAVINGLDAFEERASFRTWVTRIALNRGKTAATRAARTVPLSSLERDDQRADADRFGPNGMWAPPQPWVDEDPESLFARKEVMTRLDAALDELPERQREVVVLRDVLGWTSEEVCNALELEETNQRVLLHRGRTRLRALLEEMLKAKSP
ncbi:MAG: sigma-70 family RNA polymerase sigma factor [Myxococcota bacterium]|nr:sigma-70 family RNA polymerase sigma factor [Myxococcota bacterium]